MQTAVEQRPAYHFCPARNWMSDPNGLIQWRGRYHLFYQYNPNGAFWGTPHWGHALSSDLVHWDDAPTALTPGAGPDEDGCWSGCAVVDRGVPTLVYTGVDGGNVRREHVCLARGDNRLVAWRKDPANPVIGDPPPHLSVTGFRDPYVWRENGEWRLVLGSGIRGSEGAVLLYRSTDLLSWEYLKPLCTRPGSLTDPLWTGSMWECPQFFPLGDRHVLMVSIWEGDRLHHVAHAVGRYRDSTFEPESWARLDVGGEYYAAATMLDERGRRLVMGWSWEARSRRAQEAADWAGVQTLPRVLTLSPDRTLRVEPIPEVAVLRGAHRRAGPLQVPGGTEFVLPGVDGDCLEIVLEMWSAGEAGIVLRRSPHREEELMVRFDWRTQFLAIDRSRSSIDPDAYGGVHGGTFPLAAQDALRLHIFLDRSIVEVYAGDTLCATERIYPLRHDSTGMSFRAMDAPLSVASVDVWHLNEGGAEHGNRAKEQRDEPALE